MNELLEKAVVVMKGYIGDTGNYVPIFNTGKVNGYLYMPANYGSMRIVKKVTQSVTTGDVEINQDKVSQFLGLCVKPSNVLGHYILEN